MKYAINFNPNRELLGLSQINTKSKKYSNYSGSDKLNNLLIDIQNRIANEDSCNGMYSGTGSGTEVIKDSLRDLKNHVANNPETDSDIRAAINIINNGCKKITSLKCFGVDKGLRSIKCQTFVATSTPEILSIAQATRDRIAANIPTANTPPPTPPPSDDGGHNPPPSTSNGGSGADNGGGPQQAGFFGNITSSNITTAIGITLGLAVLTTGIMWMVNKKQRPNVMVK